MGKRYWRSNTIHFNQSDTVLRPSTSVGFEIGTALISFDLYCLLILQINTVDRPFVAYSLPLL
jgi:hypothetical protein